MKKNEGITLVALVITIIILIILATIGISLALGENGLIEKTKVGGKQYQNSANEERNELNSVLNFINNIDGIDNNNNNNNVEENVEKYYLFKDGDEYTDVTGGWKLNYYGYLDSPLWSKTSNNTVLHGGTYLKNSYDTQGSAMVTSSKIDLSEYSKICLKMEIVTDNYNAGSIFGEISFGNSIGTSWADSRRWNLNSVAKNFRDNENLGSGIRTYKFNIEDSEKNNAHIYIIGNNNTNGAGGEIADVDVYIHEIWLEK